MNKILLAYSDLVIAEFPRHMAKHQVACILMNNMQQLRVQLDKVYRAMGGDDLDPDAADILKELQQKLNGVLDELASHFAMRYELCGFSRDNFSVYEKYKSIRRSNIIYVDEGMH